MFRKDRASGIGGGVFLMISSEFVCSDPGFPCPKEVEMVWAQIQVTGSKSVSVCSFYQPPNNTDSAYIDALKDAVAHIDTSADYVWIAGDFNLGDIDWQSSSIKPCCQHAPICEQLIEMANDHCSRHQANTIRAYELHGLSLLFLDKYTIHLLG